MATIDYSIESKTTKEIRESRRKMAERYSTMTNEEIMAEQRESRRELEAMGMVIKVRDPRTEPRT